MDKKRRSAVKQNVSLCYKLQFYNYYRRIIMPYSAHTRNISQSANTEIIILAVFQDISILSQIDGQCINISAIYSSTRTKHLLISPSIQRQLLPTHISEKANN